MSFFEKNPYSSSIIDKKESISDQQSDSPRRLKVALKYFRSDEKFHNDGQPMDSSINNIDATTNDAAAVEESVKSTDGIVPKVRHKLRTMNTTKRLCACMMMHIQMIRNIYTYSIVYINNNNNNIHAYIVRGKAT